MRTTRRTFISTSTLLYFTQTDETTLPTETQTIQIPISSSETESPAAAAAVVKIQSAYRSHRIRTLYRTISTVNSEADHLQRRIQQQDTVDAIRRDEREKLRMNEALMALLLKLDAVPGAVDASVREARRKVSRRIVGLQEILDAVSDSRAEDLSELMGRWEEAVAEMEAEAWWWGHRDTCAERREIERFCVEKLGFRCMERFIHG